jgi:hypothetical protein
MSYRKQRRESKGKKSKRKEKPFLLAQMDLHGSELRKMR